MFEHKFIIYKSLINVLGVDFAKCFMFEVNLNIPRQLYVQQEYKPLMHSVYPGKQDSQQFIQHTALT